MADFATACWWHSNAPQAHFTQNLVCSLPTETGRITLSGRRLVVTEAGASRNTELPEGAVLKAYQEHFGIVLDRVPNVLPVPRREAPAATGRGER
ncbi:arylamine N-acetyltransferase [Streptomyces cadmiisoli]|uniref:arylamine N-acetyltransferase n=1 Tax=Streptomyces cadmiisoli TaxID=2184053 RepID=UPI00319D9EB0